MKTIILLLMLFAMPASARVIATTGEHGPFTRVVLQFPELPDWRFGRTESGYELSVDGVRPNYDLTNAFRLIDRQRLKTIWADPETGNLKLGLACACHAVVETLGTRILIVDIHDGPPPDQEFEKTLAGAVIPPLGKSRQITPKPRPFDAITPTYDWTSLPAGMPSGPGKVQPPQETPTPLAPHYGLREFRERLTQQLALDGARGLVSLPNTQLESEGEGEQPKPNFRIGPPAVLSQNGTTCPHDADLSLENWAAGTNPAAEMATARKSILGEFDATNQANLQAAIRTHLYFSFGAEARNMIHAFGYDQPDKSLLLAIAHLVDGETPSNNPFENMQTCTGHAALWALVAHTGKTPLIAVNANSIVQVFFALPRNVQNVIASDLAQKLILAKHPNAAEMIVNALKRSAQETDHKAHLVAAEVAVEREDFARAKTELAAVTQDQNDVRSLTIRAETGFRDERAPTPDFVTEMDALYFTQGKGPEKEKILRAHALTKAAAGDFATALDLPDLTPETVRDIWEKLATLGSDGALLMESASISAKDRNLLGPEIVEKVGLRLAGLGLVSLAEGWIGDTPVSADLRAELAIVRHDGRAALSNLEQVAPETAADLRPVALALVGEFAAASELLRTSGKADEAHRLDRWSQDWSSLGGNDDSWSRLAETASNAFIPSSDISLAQTADLLEEAATQVKDVETLLAATALPHQNP